MIPHGRAAAQRTPVVERLRAEDPTVVGRFRIEARLGVGGMGQVYLGRSPEGRQAAIKVIHDDLAGDTEFRSRFRREVSAALSVAGAFTARVLDADPEGHPPWLATEYVHGPTLRDAVYRSGPLSPTELKTLAAGLADAVAAIHAAGLIHRDLKPANVLLSPTGPKVIDFGIAWSVGGERHTGTGQAVGTPEYLAPEQITGYGPGRPPIDIFALGATLVFAATGRGPFEADQPAAVLFRITQHSPDLSRVPPELRELLGACLEKDPRRRPTARQIAAHLRTGRPLTAAVDERSTRPVTLPAGREAPRPDPPPAPEPPDRPAGPTRRRWSSLVTLAAVLVLAAALLIWQTLQAPEQPQPQPVPVVAPADFEPLSPEVHSAAIDRFVDGNRSVSLAATCTEQLELPPS